MANNVTTYHYDRARTGWNQDETTLTPATVGSPKFKQLFQYGSSILDNIMYAQPLYVEGLTINGKSYNVVFVATESATVYAFDADQFDSGPQPWLWRRSLISWGTGPACLIQSSFGAGPNHPGNFEALIQEGANVVHYYRDNSTSGLPWYRTAAVSSVATGPASLIQSTFGSPNQPGNFEALVQEGSNIVHYWRDNSTAGYPWNRTAVVSSAATGPACLIQSSFGAGPNQPGNFEALVQEGSNIVHYYRDNSAPGYPWYRTIVVSSAATGPASLIQSSFGAGPNQPGNFEALVQEGSNIVHYYRDNSAPGYPWYRTVLVSSLATGPAALIQSTFGAGAHPGNFEALVQESSNVVHYWRDNSAAGYPWNRTVVVSSAATSPASLIQSGFGASPSTLGNFEALIEEGDNVVHYWRNDSAPGYPWSRTVIVGPTESGAGDGALKSTPVIDAAKGLMFVAGRFQSGQGQKYFRLHSIDLTNGCDRLGPTLINQNTVPAVVGAGQPQNAGGQVYFDPAMHWNRPALLLANDMVYLGFGSTGDVPPYHGWLIGFGTSDLQLINAFCTTPDGAGVWEPCWNDPDLGGAIWQAGFGPAADSNGNVYCITANGVYGSLQGNPARNYADSLLKLSSGVNLLGSFTPSNPGAPGVTPNDPAGLAHQDVDFGSAGALVLPDGSGGGNFVVGCGKDANVFLINRDTLALNQLGNIPLLIASGQAIALISNPGAEPPTCGGGPGVWGGPAYYGGPLGDIIYYCGDKGPLQALLVSGGALTRAQTASGVPNQTPVAEAFPNEGGVIPVVTSNGTKAGTAIVWAVARPDNLGQLHLRAYDAADLTKGHLSDGVIGGWTGGGAFLAPIVVNGKVYVASDHQLTVWGLS
jgi:hypothetical protein